MVSISREEYEEFKGLKAEVAKLKKELDWFKECLKLHNKKQFGASSEKTSDLCIFNEAETYANTSEPEPELSKVKEHYRKGSKKSAKDRLPKDLPVEVIECELPLDERDCPACGEPLHAMGKETVREELKIIPPRIELRRYVRNTYSCRNCEKKDITVPVIKAPVPKAVIKGGFASPEAVAYIATQKYVLSVPLFRQEQELKRNDILLSRQTMCNWLMKVSEDWLQPIYDRLPMAVKTHVAFLEFPLRIRKPSYPGYRDLEKRYQAGKDLEFLGLPIFPGFCFLLAQRPLAFERGYD